MCHFLLISDEYEQCGYGRRTSRKCCFSEERIKTEKVQRVTLKTGELHLKRVSYLFLLTDTENSPSKSGALCPGL